MSGSVVKKMIIDILNSNVSNELKYEMTNEFMNWDQIGIDGCGVDEEVYAYRELWELATDINEALMNWSSAKFDEIYDEMQTAMHTKKPMVIGLNNYWNRYCMMQLLSLSPLPATADEAAQAIDIGGGMCDEFINLATGPKMEMIIFLLNEDVYGCGRE